MPFRRLLVATDGSAAARGALDRAIELARLSGGSITALYVVDDARLAILPPQSDWTLVHDALRDEARRVVEDACAAARAADVPAEPLVKDGHAAQAIVEAARDHDVVVLGTLGRSGLAHLLLGSVAERVVRHAPCPVLAVRRTKR